MANNSSPTTEDPDHEPPAPKAGFSAFWAELKRRKVMRVAITYVVVAWLIIQVASTTFGSFGIPEWAFRFVVLMLILGFPVALIITWAFELTPDGIKTTKSADAERGDKNLSKSQEKKRNWFTILFAAAVPTLIFGTLAIFFYFRSPHVTPDVSGGGSHALSSSNGLQVADLDKSIAVLPLENMSPDEENAFFADGVQEDILTNLSKIDDFLVISRSSTLQYRNADRNLKEIGAELGVRYLLEGSVRRVANQVRITVQLIDSSNDDHIWAENYDRTLDDVFAIQAEIAQVIADKLQAVISPEEIEKLEYRPTDNQEAYDNYMKAWILAQVSTSRHDEKISLLEKAVTLDPNFAEAWVQLAHERSWLWRNSGRTNEQLLADAHRAFERASQTGPNLPHIHYLKSTLIWNETGDIEGSIPHLRKAIEIDPNYYDARRALGFRLNYLGQLEEAKFHLEAAHRVDPLSVRANDDLYYLYTDLRQWDKLYALIEKNLKQTGMNLGWEIRWAVTEYLESGDLESYLATLTNTEGLKEDKRWQTMIALYEGDCDKALELISSGRQALRYLSDGGLTIHSGKAFIAFVCGNPAGQRDAVQGPKRVLEEQAKDPLEWPSTWAQLALCNALEGDRNSMELNIAELRKRTDTSNYRYAWKAGTELVVAVAYLVLGEEETALEILEKASSIEGAYFFNRELPLWSVFNKLRGNPRFDKLLED